MMGRKRIIGVMGAGERATPEDVKLAEQLGKLIAKAGWILLTGGRDAGVMAAACKGAKAVPNSLTLGILPGYSHESIAEVDIAILTGMGHARNVINVLTSEVVVVCGSVGAGTASEAALAIKTHRPLILMAPNPETEAFFSDLSRRVTVVKTPDEAIEEIEERLERRR
jgi:uncharacterized protein (TIGR00725 family)